MTPSSQLITAPVDRYQGLRPKRHCCTKFPQGGADSLCSCQLCNQQIATSSFLFLLSSPDKTHATGGLGGPPVCRRRTGTKARCEVRRRPQMAATSLLRSRVPLRNWSLRHLETRRQVPELEHRDTEIYWWGVGGEGGQIARTPLFLNLGTKSVSRSGLFDPSWEVPTAGMDQVTKTTTPPLSEIELRLCKP
jgi:hypothetical protein